MNQPLPIPESTEAPQKGLRLVKSDRKNIFTEHPAATGETYGQHWWFTVKMSARLLFTSVVLFLHGILPFLFVRTASNQMTEMGTIMQARKQKQL